MLTCTAPHHLPSVTYVYFLEVHKNYCNPKLPMAICRKSDFFYYWLLMNICLQRVGNIETDPSEYRVK